MTYSENSMPGILTGVQQRTVGFALMLFAFTFALAPVVSAQHQKANYQLAARFAPYKMQQLIYSTSVSPKWIEGSEKFRYDWKTSEGTFYYLVDPVRGTKTQIFDNDRLAAELTRITKDPWDSKHLPIRKIKFIDENTLQFEVESSQEEEIIEEEVDEEEGISLRIYC